MEYVINVAKKENKIFRHYFMAVVPYRNLKVVYEELKERYPDCLIDVTKYEKIGHAIDMENF